MADLNDFKIRRAVYNTFDTLNPFSTKQEDEEKQEKREQEWLKARSVDQFKKFGIEKKSKEFTSKWEIDNPVMVRGFASDYVNIKQKWGEGAANEMVKRKNQLMPESGMNHSSAWGAAKKEVDRANMDKSLLGRTAIAGEEYIKDEVDKWEEKKKTQGKKFATVSTIRGLQESLVKGALRGAFKIGTGAGELLTKGVVKATEKSFGNSPMKKVNRYFQQIDNDFDTWQDMVLSPEKFGDIKVKNSLTVDEGVPFAEVAEFGGEVMIPYAKAEALTVKAFGKTAQEFPRLVSLFSAASSSVGVSGLNAIAENEDPETTKQNMILDVVTAPLSVFGAKKLSQQMDALAEPAKKQMLNTFEDVLASGERLKADFVDDVLAEQGIYTNRWASKKMGGAGDEALSGADDIAGGNISGLDDPANVANKATDDAFPQDPNKVAPPVQPSEGTIPGVQSADANVPEVNTSVQSAERATSEFPRGDGGPMLPQKAESTIATPNRLTSDVETPIEFAVGKQGMQKKNIELAAKPFTDKINDLNPTPEQSKQLFDAFENPDKFAVPDFEGADDLIAEARRVNEFLTTQKKTRELLENAWDDETYLRTILEDVNGDAPSAEAMADLKNSANATFREQLVSGQRFGGSKLSTKNVADKKRKFATADERDVVLEQFGLRTKRDFAASMKANIDLTKKITANQDFNTAVRNVASSGERADIKQAYDPFENSRFRDATRQELRDSRNAVLDELRESKLITEGQSKAMKAEIKINAKQEAKTVKEAEEFALSDIKDISEKMKTEMSIVDVSKKADKARLIAAAEKKIDKLRKSSVKKIQDYYGNIVKERGKMIDQGFKDLGEIRGAEQLRGVMVKENDFNAVTEILNELKPSSAEDMARSLKAVQATLDLFQLPQALRSSIQTNGAISGSWDWLKSVSGVANKNAKPADFVEASEFVQLGRHKDFDIDIWDKYQKEMGKEVSKFSSIMEKVGTATDVPGIKQIKNALGEGLGQIEKYQWETVMIPLKTDAWNRKVANLKKAFPNLSDREIKIEAGRAVDDFFGGQNWDKLMARNPKAMSRQMQRTARIIIFAADYLTSSVRSLKRETLDTVKGGVKGKLGRDSLLRKLIYGLGVVNAISYSVNGHSTFENDDPNQFYKIQTDMKDEKGNPYYLDLMGNWGQTFNMLNRPVSAISGKTGGIGRTITGALSGDGISLEGFNPMPFNTRGMTEKIASNFFGSKAAFGVPEDVNTAAKLQLMEFFGVSGTFSGGKSKTATIAKTHKDVFKNPENLWRYITGRDEVSQKESVTKMIKNGDIGRALSETSPASNSVRDAMKDVFKVPAISNKKIRNLTYDEIIAVKEGIGRMTDKEREVFLATWSPASRKKYQAILRMNPRKPTARDEAQTMRRMERLQKEAEYKRLIKEGKRKATFDKILSKKR